MLDFLKTGGSSEFEGYSEGGPGSEIGASGGRRRRRTLRRKGARKGTRKGSRKHYGGNSYQKQQQQQQQQQQQGGNPERIAELGAKEAKGELSEGEKTELARLRNPPNPPNPDGGSRRRKGSRGKKTHSKKTRGKKTSAWIKHVLQFAKDNKMKYFQALKDKRCRATYKSQNK